MVSVIGTGVAAPASTAATGSSSIWAYGVVRSVDFEGTTASGAPYQGSATYGFSVILNETNGSFGTFTLSVNRTMGALVSVTYCRPDCTHPLATVTLSLHAWESTNASANLSTDATVNESSGSVPALGLNSSSTNVQAGLRIRGAYAVGSDVLLARTISVNVSADAGVVLSPALGLVPLSLAPGTNWTSAAAFAATGAYNWTAENITSGSLLNATVPVETHGGGAVNRTGTVGLAGSYAANSTVELGGARYPAVNLTFTGPFVVREGFLLIPAGADLFGGTPGPWAAGTQDFTGVSDTHLDLGSHLFVGGHLGLEASGSLWRSTTQSLSAMSVESDLTGPAALPASPAADSEAPTFLQAQPQSVGQAHDDQQCLLTGVGCPTIGASPHSLLRLVVVAGAVAVIAVLAAVAVTRRRPVAPVASPNASLYPTGAAPQRPAPPAPAPAGPGEDDPLSHLW